MSSSALPYPDLSAPNPRFPRTETIDVLEFRLRRHHSLAALPVLRRHDVHARTDCVRDRGRHHIRHAARYDAAIGLCSDLGARGRLREPDAIGAVAARDILALFPDALYRPMDHRRVPTGPSGSLRLVVRHLHAVRNPVFGRDHARWYSVAPARSSGGSAGARHDLPADDALYRAAAGLPQHGAGAAHPDDYPVPGHLPRLRALDHGFPRRSVEGGAARRAPGGDVPVCRIGLFRDLVRGFAAGAPAAEAGRDHPLRSRSANSNLTGSIGVLVAIGI